MRKNSSPSHPHPPSPPFPYPRRPSPAVISFLAARKNDRFMKIPRENQGKTMIKLHVCCFHWFFGVIKIKKKLLLEVQFKKKITSNKNLMDLDFSCCALNGASSTCAIAAWLLSTFRDFEALQPFVDHRPIYPFQNDAAISLTVFAIHHNRDAWPCIPPSLQGDFSTQFRINSSHPHINTS